MKKQFFIASALGSTLTFLPLSSSAQTEQIANAKAQIKDFEKRFGSKNKDYCYVLLNLAQAYQNCGKKKEADEQFKLAQEYAEKQPNAKSLVISLKNSWANTLLRDSSKATKEDRNTAISLLHDHEDYLDLTKASANEYLNIANTYHRAKEWSELRKIESKIQGKLDASTKVESSRGKIVGLMNSYFILGSMHVEKRNRKFIGMASSDEELEKATTYFQKVLALCERLPENDSFAIDMYRKITPFYTANGKKDLASKYTAILSKALGSSDPNVLFPPVDMCPACGRG